METGGRTLTFTIYGQSELAQIAAAIKALSAADPEQPFSRYGISLPLDEAWFRGGFKELLRRIDDITRRTSRIGQRFISKPLDDPSRMVSFHWMVASPDEETRCALDIGLCLVSPDPTAGRLILAQQVLRLGEDEFVYWGVD
jgi:hypothetical protein